MSIGGLSSYGGHISNGVYPMADISTNIARLRENIAKAARKTGHKASDITLVCITKQIPLKLIIEAVRAGISIIGENRVEEARTKWGRLPGGIGWHMVGHLQTRKVKEAVGMFDLIHSVDSIHLAQEINKRAGAIDKVQDILLEVNISGETSKYGFRPEGIISSSREIAGLPNVRVLGLMTMAPLVSAPEFTRPVFRGLKQLGDEINAQNIDNIQMKYLSMGMTQDYMVAIEEGANMVRIGTAIFKGE